MQFGRWKSNIFEAKSGLLQGSPLSSVLFNIYTADIVTTLKVDNGAKPFTYIDDVIAEYTTTTLREAVEGLQEASTMLLWWSDENHMSIQPDKAV